MKNITFLVLIVLIGCTAKVPEDIYNLKFEYRDSNYTWLITGYNFERKADTTNEASGKMVIEGANFMGFNHHFRLMQYIPVYVPVQNVEISLRCKAENYNDLIFKVICYDSEENPITTESAVVDNSGKWNKTTLRVNAENARILNVEIKGKADVSANPTDEKRSRLWLDEIEMTLDGKDIYHVNKCNDAPPSLLTEVDSIRTNVSSSDLGCYENVNALDDATIIAFGETIHGSETINETVFNHMKYLIKEKNVRLLLFEQSLNIGLLFNEYVNGNSNLNIDTLLHKYNFNSLFSPYAMKELLSWIKNFNAKTNDNVNIVGIDVDHASGHKILLNRFLLYFRFCNSETDSLLNFIFKEEYESALTFARNNKTKIAATVGAYNYEALLQAIQQNKYLKETKGIILNRDSIMWKNTVFAIDHYLKPEQKVVLYAHLGHINKKSVPYYNKPALGHFLSKSYSENYFTIGITVGQGTFNAWKDKGDSVIYCENISLQKPREGSLEYVCNKINAKAFFTVVPDKETMTHIRYQGSNYNKRRSHDLYYSLKARMDAFIYLNKSHGFKKPDEWYRSYREMSRSFIDRYKPVLDDYRSYQN